MYSSVFLHCCRIAARRLQNRSSHGRRWAASVHSQERARPGLERGAAALHSLSDARYCSTRWTRPWQRHSNSTIIWGGLCPCLPLVLSSTATPCALRDMTDSIAPHHGGDNAARTRPMTRRRRRRWRWWWWWAAVAAPRTYCTRALVL